MAPRELTRAEIDELLHEQVVGRIGCHHHGLTYVVPVIYAYDGRFVHVAAVDGQKVRMMRASPEVCFEVDEYVEGSWRSAIAQGVYEELAGDEAAATLERLAARFGRSRNGTRRHAAGASTVCFRIRLRTVTGRALTR